MRDLKTHRTQRVSVSSNGAQGSSHCLQPAISANGRFVAFVSSSRLVPAASGGALEVFIRDLKTDRTRLVSVSSAGAVGNSASFRPSISTDGSRVAFESFASNLVAGDTNDATDVFLHDSRTGRTQRLSVTTGGAQGNDASFLPSISDDGRYVAFESTADNLTTGDSPGTDDLFIRDLREGLTQRLSHTSGGNLNLNSQQYEHADISNDGRYVTSASMAAHLVAGDTNGLEDVFIRGPLHP